MVSCFRGAFVSVAKMHDIELMHDIEFFAWHRIQLEHGGMRFSFTHVTKIRDEVLPLQLEVVLGFSVSRKVSRCHPVRIMYAISCITTGFCNMLRTCNSGCLQTDTPAAAFNDSMIQWFNDSMIQWFNDSMIQWFNDSIIRWFNDSILSARASVTLI